MLLAPSILAADLADFTAALDVCERGKADLVHVDVMDGHFVPNLTFGPPVIEHLRRHTELPLDVHLMVSNPEERVPETLAAGAAWISVHWEASTHLDRLVGVIRDGGAKAGVALNPATPVELLADVLPELDFVLLMSVNPGFAGQSFVGYSFDKVGRLRRMIAERGLEVEIEMDGGIGLGNIARVVASGVDACVAGSAIFGAEDPVARMAELREAAGGAGA